MKRYYFIITFLVFASTLSMSQNLRTQNQSIVNEAGNEVLLRGMGPGGWLLMEGYMMQTAGVAGTQHEFRDKLIELIGEENTNTFFEEWRKHHFTRRDVDSLATWGFNSIRVPLHYNLFTLPIEEEPDPTTQTWLTSGFTILDSLLDWCEDNEIYLILDLHAAPGGQGYNADISDYDPSKPSLWESDRNKTKTVELWRKLAERYKNEAWIGGYDLINEPNWDLPGGTELRALYEDITEAIRGTGDQHIIFIEGNWFANDFTGLTPPWDDNMVYSFHKYWNTNNENDLDWVLPMREEYNVPLWMGESGENSNTWYTNAIKLFENNNIGWSWWTMRKIESINSPYNIKMNPGYRRIIEYWRGEASKPDSEEAFRSMMQLVENLKIENSEYRKDVVDALFRRVRTKETIPYSAHTIPGTIHLSDFDLGRDGEAYSDQDVANHQLSTGSFSAWNQGWSYRNDGVDIESNNDPESNGYHVSHVGKGEWLHYQTTIKEEGNYQIFARVAAQESGGEFHIEVDNEVISPVQKVTATGGWTSFSEISLPIVQLPKGTHTLAFHVDGNTPFNIGSLKIEKSNENIMDFIPLYAETGINPDEIILHFNKKIQAQIAIEDFSLQVNNQTKTISSFLLDGKTLMLKIDESLLYNDQVLVSYSGNSIISDDNESLDAFSGMKVINKLNERFLIPGIIEVEEYEKMEGFQLEETDDAGGGQNLGFVNVGDYAEYPVTIKKTSYYELESRIASLSDQGKFSLKLLSDSSEIDLLDVTTEPTGGWQIWTSQYALVRIPKGEYTLRLEILSNGEFNLNWIKFVDTITGLKQASDGLIVPNPSSDFITVHSTNESQVIIYTSAGKIVKTGKTNKEIDIQQLNNGLYFIGYDDKVLKLIKN